MIDLVYFGRSVKCPTQQHSQPALGIVSLPLNLKPALQHIMLEAHSVHPRLSLLGQAEVYLASDIGQIPEAFRGAVNVMQAAGSRSPAQGRSCSSTTASSVRSAVKLQAGPMMRSHEGGKKRFEGDYFACGAGKDGDVMNQRSCCCCCDDDLHTGSAREHVATAMPPCLLSICRSRPISRATSMVSCPRMIAQGAGYGPSGQ